MIQFCDVLREMRSELGLTQLELANAFSVSFATISRWELGKTYPTRSMMAALLDYAEAHNVSAGCKKRLHIALQTTKKERLTKANSSTYAVERSSLGQIIDDADFPIYVCDMETDELLYINHSTEELLGCKLNELKNKACYKCLMHRSSPCPNCRKELLRDDRFLTFDAFRPVDGAFYRVSGKLLQWNGHRAHVRTISGIGNSMSVEAKEVQQASYIEQCRIRQELACDAVASARYNLTRNTVTDVVSEDLEIKIAVSFGCIDETLRLMGETVFSEDEQQKFDSIRDRQSLIRQFYTGTTHISVKHFLNGRPNIYESTFDLMQNPVTYDIEAFASMKDITDVIMAEEIVRKLLSIDYETITAINAETGQAHPYFGSHINDIISEQKRLVDNIGGVEAYLRKYCADEDVDSVVKETSLPYVKQQLEEKDVFTTAYSLQIDGAIIHKRILYTYLDRMKTNILCAMQNLTDNIYHSAM